jgi:hypothetical protein
MISTASLSACQAWAAVRRGPPMPAIASWNPPAPRPSSKRPQRQVRHVREQVYPAGAGGQPGDVGQRVDEIGVVRMVLDPGVLQSGRVGDSRDARGDGQAAGIGVHIDAERDRACHGPDHSGRAGGCCGSRAPTYHRDCGRVVVDRGAAQRGFCLRWQEQHDSALIEAALTNGVGDGAWHADRWGVVFEVLFDTEQQWEAFRSLPGPADEPYLDLAAASTPAATDIRPATAGA